MVNQQTFDTIRLIRTKNLGVKTFHKLLKIFGTPQNILKNLANYTKRHPIIPCKEEIIETEIKNCEKIGAEIITIFDEYYPYNLKQIDNAPLVLTIKGNKNLLRNENRIAIVGARNASANGYNFSSRISRDLGNEGFIIVSGLARGIDTSAHKSSLDTGTIAVIAGGIDNIYPQENEGLYHEITKKGLIISEYPYGTAPRSQNFPARNRIVSGFSKGVVVIEASLRSGTLITANRALEQGREIFVAPGNPYDPRCEGSNKLIKDGATLITDAYDVIDSISSFEVQTKIKRDYIKSQKEQEYDLFDNNLADSLFEKKDGKEEGEDNKVLQNPRELVLSKLNETPIAIELLSNQLNVDITTINSIISELELEGSVLVEFGKVKFVK